MQSIFGQKYPNIHLVAFIALQIKQTALFALGLMPIIRALLCLHVSLHKYPEYKVLYQTPFS